MYLQNKYTTWYNNIVSRAKNRTLTEQFETHHIIPKSFFLKNSGWIDGNPDDSDNLVRLTIREHRLCHLLLPKMTSGIAKSKMVYAANILLQDREIRFGLSKGKLYESIKQEAIVNLTKSKIGKPLSKETKDKIKQKRALQVIRKMSEETKLKISQSHKGKKKTPEHKNKVIKNLKNWSGEQHSESTKEKMRKPKSAEHRLSMSKARKGKPLSEDLKKKLSDAKLLAPSFTCPHCGKNAKAAMFSRWHGDNCRLLKDF